MTKKSEGDPRSAEVETVTDFLEFIEEHCESEDFLFRGQRQDVPLVPRIGRLALRRPISTVETEMLDDFKSAALPLIQARCESDWDWVSIARHHGLPTRLLDWTTSPLAALWFAVHDQPATGEHGPLPGVVWAFERSADDNVDPKLGPFHQPATKVFRPRHLTPRIIAQSGWFTVHRLLASRKSFVAFQNNKDYKERLRKITIPPAAFAGLRRRLAAWGINSATLYADLDGLCRHLEARQTVLDDEWAGFAYDQGIEPDRD